MPVTTRRKTYLSFNKNSDNAGTSRKNKVLDIKRETKATCRNIFENISVEQNTNGEELLVLYNDNEETPVPSRTNISPLSLCKGYQEHVSTLPLSVHDLAMDVLITSNEIEEAQKRHKEPPAKSWQNLFARFQKVALEYDRSCISFNSSHSLRMVVKSRIYHMESCAMNHSKIRDRLILIMYWCCLGHAGQCSLATIYEREKCILDLFRLEPGCGITPPDEAIYWKELYILNADERYNLPEDAKVAKYIALRKRLEYI